MKKLIALLAVVVLAGCAPADPPSPPEPAPSVSIDPVPTLQRWVNVPCSPPGARAKSRSGGDLVCEQVGSDAGPEWHASVPAEGGTP